MSAVFKLIKITQNTYLVCYSVALIKTMSESSLELSHHSPSWRELRAGSQRQELNQRPKRNTSY